MVSDSEDQRVRRDEAVNREDETVNREDEKVNREDETVNRENETVNRDYEKANREDETVNRAILNSQLLGEDKTVSKLADVQFERKMMVWGCRRRGRK